GDPGGAVADRQADALTAEVEDGGEQPHDQAADEAEAEVVGPRRGCTSQPGEEGGGGKGRHADQDEGGQGQDGNPGGPDEVGAETDPSHRGFSLLLAPFRPSWRRRESCRGR